MKIIKTLNKFYSKLPNSGKILIFLIVFLCIVYLFKYVAPLKEGMKNEEKVTFKKSDEVYDNFYVGIYDFLVYSPPKNDFEVGTIINSGKPDTSSVIADIGCGTGHHVELLQKKNLNVIGVDKSVDMISLAKKNYPDCNFVVGNALDNGLFKMNSLTHVLCLYFTVYYIKDKQQFFNNVMDWLMPNGYFYIHLVDRDRFDPILPPGNPLFIVSPQKYAKDRITNTKVTFNNFVYTSNFKLDKDGDLATFDEKFKYNDGKVRKQQQMLYMEDAETIVNMIQNSGFILEAKFDMVKCGYESQYLYVFTRPS
jgi:SAM-dependent methyltransferase